MLEGAGFSDSIEEPILVWAIGSRSQVIMVEKYWHHAAVCIEKHILTPICVTNMTTKHHTDHLVMVIHIRLATQAALVCLSPCSPAS